MYCIDLNCDVGEGFVDEAAIMPLISSCSIACGGHFGDRSTIESTVALAHEHQVAIGVHPAYPDPVNFGRKSLAISMETLQEALRQQLDLFWKVEQKVNHIKPHGALYNDLFSDDEKGEAVLAVFEEYLPGGKIYCPPTSPWSLMIKEKGFIPVYEGFGDRSYTHEGKLRTRNKAGSVFTDKQKIVAQILQMIQKQTVTSFDLHEIPVEVQTICLHGDNPGILHNLEFIQHQFKLNEISIQHF